MPAQNVNGRDKRCELQRQCRAKICEAENK